MSAANWLGAGLLALIFIGLYVCMARVMGGSREDWFVTAVVWGLAFALTGLIYLAFWLATS